MDAKVAPAAEQDDVAELKQHIEFLEARNAELESLEQQMQGLLQENRVQHAELKARNVELKRIGAELEETTRRYRNLFELAPIAHVSMDANGTLHELNAASTQLLGYRKMHLRQSTIWCHVHPSDRETLEAHLEKVLSGRHDTIELNLLHSTGKSVPVFVRSAPVGHSDGNDLRCQSAMMDMTDHRRTEEQLRRARDYLQHMAHHDPLTDLPNRLLFNDRLRHALHRARRAGQQVALIFIDVDRFKLINDSLGHTSGDRLLCGVATRIKDSVREADTVCRIGGDEFTVILENVARRGDVDNIARKLLDAVNRVIEIDGHQIATSASIGVSLYPSDAIDVGDLVKFADAAMYRSKQLGGNSAHFFSAKLDATLFNRFNVERELRGAVERGELVLHYQPQCSASSGRVEGLEALLRWNHPVHGQLMPSDFVPTAEESTLIVELGEWALRRACAQHRDWSENGFVPPRVAVNISARHLNQTGLSEFISRTLAETGTPADAIELELTETALLLNPESAATRFAEIRSMGVHIAIDDFGTGYSSLSRLRTLPLSRLKIDSAFVQGVESSNDDRAIANAIISMAHGLNLGVVSEGVENERQRRFLQSSGCDLLQGFHLGYPMDASEVEQILERRA